MRYHVMYIMRYSCTSKPHRWYYYESPRQKSTDPDHTVIVSFRCAYCIVHVPREVTHDASRYADKTEIGCCEEDLGPGGKVPAPVHVKPEEATQADYALLVSCMTIVGENTYS